MSHQHRGHGRPEKDPFGVVIKTGGGTSDYANLINKPSIEGVTLNGDVSLNALGTGKIYHDTTANWALQLDFIPDRGSIIIYEDYATVDDVAVPNFKIGDGLAHVVDLPFVTQATQQGIIDYLSESKSLVTPEDRQKWDEKVSCSLELLEDGTYALVFSND